MTCLPLRGEVDRMAEHEIIKEQMHTECIVNVKSYAYP